MSALAVFGDVVILLALVAAIASPTLSQGARALIAVFAFSIVWLLTAVLEGLRAPSWTMVIGVAVTVLSIIVITVTLHLWALGGSSGASGPGPRGGCGGGGPGRRGPDASPSGGGGTNPSWWGEFERQFALHVAECERAKHQPLVSPTEPVRTSTRPSSAREG